MRILLINYEYPPVGAGAATASQQIARALVSQGHSATVLTTRFGSLVGTSDEEGVRVIRLNSRRARRESASITEMISYVIQASRVVRKIIRDERIDGIIAFFSIPGGPVARWAHRGTRVPYLVSLRGGDVPGAEPGLGLIHRALAPVRRGILRGARAVVANSVGLKTLSEKTDAVPVHVVTNGVDTAFFAPSSEPRVATEPFRLLFVGRFQPQKNLLWLLDRVAEVKGQVDRPLTLDLVGDGPQRPALLAKTKALGLDEIVRFHPWQDRAALRAYYRAVDLVINPSLYEGMPNVVLEAMACGRPVLASRVPGNESVVVDGVTGSLFSLEDAAGFREAVLHLVREPATADALGVAARARAEREYSWARTARSYLELFGSPRPVSTLA
ncbi:MAG TPA: glycosyltransferase family 4 protein [Opitutaceae bacterium]|nr:glycosyltransferase family 4 protein [Opitutaceae bacterium]